MHKTRFLALLLTLFLIAPLALSGCQYGRASGDWVRPDSYDGAFSDTGYYYLASSFLYYVDFATGANVCLCSRAGCAHNNDLICDAYLGLVNDQMFYWDEKLYYMGADQYGSHLYRRNADGTGLATVATLGEEHLQAEEKVNIEFGDKVVSDGYLYYIADVETVVQVDGVFEHRRLYSLLQQLDLRTGKEKTILKKEEGIVLVAANGTDIRYLNVIFNVKLDPDVFGPEAYDPDAIEEAYKKNTVQIIQQDTTTGEETILWETTRHNCYAVAFYSGSRLIYMTYEQTGVFNTAIYRVHDFATGKDEFFYEGYIEDLISGRYGLVIREVDQIKSYYVRDYQAGQEYPCPQFFEKGANYRIRLVAANDDTAVFLRYIRGSGDYFYAYVNTDALADGLQDGELIDFYIGDTF